eukprot:Blabericola_migrator_1__3085@NODE_18_length_22925_cov_118_464826_g15_i0_p23_GENE_NODE_18_length_22925_cov_118_464826_g15_i0NODE_18_length_22925_cov_118_464826_g15_i0_p23_ORF_typecomplete_len101_score7_65_NODE_18_length_22925_cov_118_464826_g15_i018752177
MPQITHNTPGSALMLLGVWGIGIFAYKTWGGQSEPPSSDSDASDTKQRTSPYVCEPPDDHASSPLLAQWSRINLAPPTSSGSQPSMTSHDSAAQKNSQEQ